MDKIQNIISNIPVLKFNTINSENLLFDIETKQSLFSAENRENIYNTLLYLYERYGTGIYVKILNNKVFNFIVFKNKNYINNWQKRIVDGFTNGFIDVEIDFIGLLDNFVIKNYDEIPYPFWLKTFLIDLCNTRKIPECEFFVNFARDCPVIKIDRTIADNNIGNNIVDNMLKPIQHTVFSFNTSDNFKDIAIPSLVDIERITYNTFGIMDVRQMKWIDKKNSFLFKTTSLCNGVYLNKNPINLKYSLVLKLQKLFNEKLQKYENLEEIFDKITIREQELKYRNYDIDVGITEFNDNLPVIIKSQVYTIPVEESLIPKNNTEYNLLQNKFIFLTDEVASPNELSSVLFSGSCIIRVESDWQTWFDDFLLPDIHYILLKKDLSNLREIVDWCIDNDEECKKIASNAREFATKYLGTNGIYDYWQKILNEIKPLKYDNISIKQIQYELQEEFIYNYFKEFSDLPIVKFPSLRKLNRRRTWAENLAIMMLLSKNGVYSYDDKIFETQIFDVENCNDQLNNIFIGIRVINNICREIPNFTFTYYLNFFKHFSSYTEYIEGIPIDSFLNFNPEKFVEIFTQIYLSLQLAYERYNFIHGDLKPENVIIQELENPISITYRLSTRVFSIETRYVVVIKNFSKSTILSNFELYNKMNKRMYIGKSISDISDISEISNVAKYKNKDVKYLFKKMGKKIYNRLPISKKYPSYENIPETSSPFEEMTRTVQNDDIVSSNVKFGVNKNDTGIQDSNPRLIYDHMVGNPAPYSQVVSNVFENPLPKEKTVLGNVIIQYEILQSLRSAIADLNLKFSIDIVTNDNLKKCFNFVKKHYDDVINETSILTLNNKYKLGAENVNEKEDLWGIRTNTIKYISYISKHKYSQKILNCIEEIFTSTIQDAMELGVRNTLYFYSKFFKY